MSEAETKFLYVSDHENRAVRELLSVHQTKPRLVALARAMGAGVQLLEDALFGFVVGWSIEYVNGDALDVFGKIVGEQRQGLDDNTYRRFIQARVKANVSEGTRDELIDIYALIMDAEVTHYHDAFPAGFALVALRGAFLEEVVRGRARLFMFDVKPAGVAMELIEGLLDAFTYDDGPGYDVGVYSRVL